VTVVDRSGRVRPYVTLPVTGENGIAFDTIGRFGGRLLVTAAGKSQTTVFAIDCRRHASVVTSTAPRLEGGLAVAPLGFGRFAGDLIVPDEVGGGIYAIGPKGRTRLVGASGIAAGPDVGVESEGFVPAAGTRRRSRWAALVADRRTPGNPHPGDDYLLRLSSAALAAAGVHAGDLLISSEGGAVTVDVSCAASCRVRHIADGPAIAHGEGHIIFVPG
jgi:hypothetical protein